MFVITFDIIIQYCLEFIKVYKILCVQIFIFYLRKRKLLSSESSFLFYVVYALTVLAAFLSLRYQGRYARPNMAVMTAAMMKVRRA